MVDSTAGLQGIRQKRFLLAVVLCSRRLSVCAEYVAWLPMSLLPQSMPRPSCTADPMYLKPGLASKLWTSHLPYSAALALNL